MGRHEEVEDLFWKGLDVLFRSNKPPMQSLKYFNEVILLDARHYWAYYYKGMTLLLFAKNLKKAEECLKKVVELHKTHAPAWNNLAGIQEKLGKKQAAKKSRIMAHLTNEAHNKEIKRLNRKCRNWRP